ncbi:MAG: hypothetical protein R2688_07370 [Fimbriimonadaceae bacterium]
MFQAAEIMVEAPTETVRQIVPLLSDETLAAYLDVLPMDDAIDPSEELEPERFEALLEVIPDEDAEEIRRLMAYDEDAVGRVMTEHFFPLSRKIRWVKCSRTCAWLPRTNTKPFTICLS